MINGLVSIGKMAEMNRVTVATLRLYDQLGLLTPRYTDPDTGYRYYDIAQNARLDMIAYMKELGMSLGEIGDVLRQEDITLIEIILASGCTSSSASCTASTTRWSAPLRPSSAIANRPRAVRSRWSISTGGTSGDCHVRAISMRRISAHTNRS